MTVPIASHVRNAMFGSTAHAMAFLNLRLIRMTSTLCAMTADDVQRTP